MENHMLLEYPRDGSKKDEGELNGGKRLIKNLYRKLNAPFPNTILECHMEAVIRLKDEKHLIYKDAAGLFEKGEGKKKEFRRGKNG